MEVINKTICMEPGKSRYPGLLAYIGGGFDKDNGNYNQFVMDVDFGKLSDDAEFSGLTSLGQMSYRMLIYRFHWIEKFMTNATYYRAILKGNTILWKEDREYSPTEQYVANFVNDDLEKEVFHFKFPIQDIIFLSKGDDTALWNVYYENIIGISYDDDYSYETFKAYGGVLFYKFVCRAIGKIYIPEEIQGSLVPNFVYLLDINDYIDKVNEYKNGECCDIVKYSVYGGDDILSFLKKFNNSYIENEISYFDKLKVANTPKFDIPILLTMNFDNLGLMRQDTTEDWEESILEDYKKKAEKYTENMPSWDHYQQDSMLASLRDLRRAIDDEGNDLPGYFSYDENTGEINGLCFPYVVNNAKNVYTVENGDEEDYYGDVIYSLTKNEKEQTMKFKYVIGGRLIKAGNDAYVYDILSNTGILYEEIRNYIISSVTATVEGEEVTFEYEDIDSNDEDTILSNTEHQVGTIYGKDLYGEKYLDYSPTFRDEMDLGLSDNVRWKSKIEVNRGNTTAFERHFKLFEVNTFEDLENYQNNYFALDTDEQ